MSEKRCPSRPDRLLNRRREVLERRIEYLESTIPKIEYSGTRAGYSKQELSALKALLMELDFLRDRVKQLELLVIETP